MNTKKLVYLLLLVLLLTGMACTCNLYNLVFGNRIEETILDGTNELVEELEDELPEEMQDVEEAVVDELQEHSDEEAEETLQELVDEIVEEIPEEEAEEAVEEDPEHEMGTQSNWEVIASGCEEFYVQGNEYVFHDQEGEWAVLEMGTAEIAFIIDMGKDWHLTKWMIFDANNSDASTSGFDFTLLTPTITDYFYQTDTASMVWDYEVQGNQIYGVLEFTAYKFDTIANEAVSDCTITGIISFDNILTD